MPKAMQVKRPSGASRYKAPTMTQGRSQFPLTHQHKTTFDVGELVPYFITEVVPGDTFTCKMFAFTRIFSPLLSPIMDNIEQSIDFFFVPNRLVWEHWEDFLGSHVSAGAQDTTYTVPIVDTGYTVAVGDTLSYMGVPIGLSTTLEAVCSLPLRAYGQIYDEWYRDQNLIDMDLPLIDDGADGSGDAPRALFKSAKKHDYFTSALPYLQKGTAQSVALSGDARVWVDLAAGSDIAIWSTVAEAYQKIDGEALVDVSSTTALVADSLYANLASVTVDINALREAAAVQRLLERDARAGTRHPELIKAHFGVDVPDYRTQRPEYLGGGTGWINVSPVANTSSTATEDQGELKGVGTGTLEASWAKSFVEHGWVIGILRARGEVSYQQGLDRMWSRSVKTDFLWPELAMLGEQPIYNRELWIEGDATDDAVFGYQERYAEYRYKKSLITGKFASDATGTLDLWHLAEDFASQPSLNQTFIEDQTPMTRVQAVTSEPDFIIDGRFDLKVARALPVRPVPTLAPARF